jgi:N12 class adenine-specific DNA methylase
MKRFTSNLIALTLFSLCLIIDALPSQHNVKIVSDANRSASDESGNSSEKRRINGDGLKGRKDDVQSKCGYEVERQQAHLSNSSQSLIYLIWDEFPPLFASRVESSRARK